MNTAVRGIHTERQRAIYRNAAATLASYIGSAHNQGDIFLCNLVRKEARKLGLDPDPVSKKFMADLGLSWAARPGAPFLAHYSAPVPLHLEFAGRPQTTPAANQQRHALLLDLASKRKERVQQARWYANASYRVWAQR